MTKHSSRVVIVVALVLASLFAFAGVALAQDEGTVVGEGLDGPMGVLVDPNGDVWVIDSGLGGDEPVQILNPETGEMITGTFGLSSRIVKISVADGAMTDVATVGSVASPAGASGGSRLALLDGVLYASVGDWENAPDTTPPAGIAVINRIGEDGAVEQVFDGWAFERDSNPYGVVYHSHPYGLLGGADGKLWVADAGANSIYSVDPATGEAGDVVPLEPLPGVFPRPDYDGELLTDPVPTGIAVKDGGVYVSLLSGVPFVPGSAKVLSVAEDGSISDYATGLTMLIDLRTGPDGELYAVSFGAFGPEGPVPGSGALLRIHEGDASEIVVGGLAFPTSVDFDADGNAYVTVNGVGAPGSGQVVRYDGVTAAEGTPYAAALGEMMAAMAPPADATAAVTGTAAMTETGAATGTEAAPTAEAAETVTDTSTLEPAETMVNIDDAMLEAGMFNTLRSAIDSAGLADMLGEGEYTIFAPTDAAFEALSLTDRIALYRNADTLPTVLANHVVEGRLTSADITDGMTAESLAGETLTFMVHDDGTIMVNGVTVSRPDFMASNGVVHAIDGLLMPGAEATAPEVAATEAATETAEVAATEAVTETAEAAATEATTATAEAAPAEAAAAEAASTKGSAEAPAPETLPTTGASDTPGLGLLVGGLALAALAGVAFVARRRTA